MTDNVKALKEEQRASVAVERHKNTWIAGLGLIAIGLFFLASNTNLIPGFLQGQGWALLIFIPAISSFSHAWRSYQRHGRVTPSARQSIIGGLLISTVALIFLFDLDWGVVWPVFLVIIGIGMFLKSSR